MKKVEHIEIRLHGKSAGGRITLVSAEDAELAASRKWYYSRSTGYAASNKHRKGCSRKDPTRNQSGRLHSLIMGKKPGFQVDHINRNRLDNRRENLRFVTHQENCWNTPPSVGKYKGVYWSPRDKQWSVTLQRRKLGMYSDEKTAALVYDKAVRKFCNEVAYLNFPEEKLDDLIKVPHVDYFPRKPTSTYRGVSWHMARGKWRVVYRKGRKQVFVGYFDDEKEAADAYKRAKACV